MNTRFSYMYRDAANWKDFYDCVIAGELSEAQKEAIQDACDGIYFIPAVLGLPGGAQPDDPDYDVRYDHPWCEFDAECDLELTEDPPTVSYTADTLTQAFQECQDKWEALSKKESVVLPRVKQTQQPETDHIPTADAVWSRLNDVKLSYDTTDPAYIHASNLLASICKQQFPELYSSIFQQEDLDLIFQNPDGSFQLVYYNPDADAGGQLVQCPFDTSQASRMQNEAAYLDVLGENTQYLLDIDNQYFFHTVFELLSAKAEGRFLGTDVTAVCHNICVQAKTQSSAKDSLHAKLSSAAARAGAHARTDKESVSKTPEREDDPYEK